MSCDGDVNTSPSTTAPGPTPSRKRSADLEPSRTESKTFSKARPLAERIGVSAKTLFRWADAGFVARHKINARVVLFDTAEVENFVLKARIA